MAFQSKFLQERKVLATIAKRQKAKAAADKIAAQPEVGIIFVVGNTPFIDGTPLNEAGGYGDCKIHDKDHYGYWDQLVENHLVPSIEYDEVPRGRVVYNIKTRSFVLFLDRCIIKNTVMVEKIKDWMHLPSNTPVETDSHYRCPGCMKKSPIY